MSEPSSIELPFSGERLDDACRELDIDLLLVTFSVYAAIAGRQTLAFPMASGNTGWTGDAIFTLTALVRACGSGSYTLTVHSG